MKRTLGAKVTDGDYAAFDRECVNRGLTHSRALTHLIQGFIVGRFRVEVNEPSASGQSVHAPVKGEDGKVIPDPTRVVGAFHRVKVGELHRIKYDSMEKG